MEEKWQEKHQGTKGAKKRERGHGFKQLQIGESGMTACERSLCYLKCRSSSLASRNGTGQGVAAVLGAFAWRSCDGIQFSVTSQLSGMGCCLESVMQVCEIFCESS